ncbi:putative DNA-directed RNA polymerase II 14.5 kDa polypeptide [Microstroma glucosiphilum]|uniref:DNA-directed RNA polymerase subunit n=1 Tax=Pseudomicrostroma glucosiphilum TaxID=1684307 RepID=A0A316UGL8_9BASI|nr:putative DNA-directed RNA polymerase II 14.5 kDa polypeptide [Pseudomicrostroma glucosiphilum]PWN24064.1 putative DNA-directed RNA polymerase II 14.5 kDa polypeptide [Pseudomicrostroma glucosiphilum]
MSQLDPQSQREKDKQSLHFCAECNNLLYPEVDRSNHVLLYSCRNCSHKEEARSNMVFKNDLKSVTKEQSGVIDSIATDPTLPRKHDSECPACGHPEAVYFQDQSKRIHNRMILFYVCTACEHCYGDELASSER